MTDKKPNAFQRILINADDQPITLSLVHGDVDHLDYYVDDGRLIRCPKCDRRVDDSLQLSENKSLWSCHACRHHFIVVSVDEPEALDEQTDRTAHPSARAARRAARELPNAYHLASEMARRSMREVHTRAALAQASAWLTYGDPQSALDVVMEFEPRFTARYGASS